MLNSCFLLDYLRVYKVPNASSEDDRADFTVSGRDRYVDERSAEDSHSRGELNDKTTRGGDLGQVLANSLNDTAT